MRGTLIGVVVGVILALGFIKLAMWILGLSSFERPRAIGLGEIGILYTLFHTFSVIVIAVFGYVGGVVGRNISETDPPDFD